MEQLRQGIKYRRVARILDGSWPKTKLIDQHPAKIRDKLIEFARRHNAGQPIAAFYCESEIWTLLTTTHLAWCIPEEGARALPFSEVGFTDFTPQDVKRITEDNSFKARVDRLFVRDKSGSSWIFMLEPDVPFYRFWRAIKLLVETTFGAKKA